MKRSELPDDSGQAIVGPSIGASRLASREVSRKEDGIAARLTFDYDREADILQISKCPPHPEQESEELGDDVVENVEVLFFSIELLRTTLFEPPVTADLRLVATL